jgi:hypothetical protein
VHAVQCTNCVNSSLVKSKTTERVDGSESMFVDGSSKNNLTALLANPTAIRS